MKLGTSVKPVTTAAGRPLVARSPVVQRAGLRPGSPTQPVLVTRVAETDAPSAAAPEAPRGVAVPKTDKPRVVVLGSGWGSVSFLKALKKYDAQKYDIVLISPRNYFLYTPLLPAVATGTMEERSIVEPIRNICRDKAQYYEAQCSGVDPKAKTITACFPKDAGFPEACFRMTYDHLIVSVGSTNNTFGVKGVAENCFFFKGIRDAAKLRRHISECFERAALPYTSQEERKKLLSFVIVGGGPTGVEVAAEMYDMMTQDMKLLYPDIMSDVKIRVVELMDYVLSSYDRKLGEYTAELFKRNGVELVLNSRVSNVEAGCVDIVDKAGVTTSVPFGACVWATGIAMNPLIKEMQGSLPGQTHFRSLVTDDHLSVLGSEGSIWALGDASTIAQPFALEYVDELFEQADVDGSGTLTLVELRNLLSVAKERFPQFEEHARFLNTREGGQKRFGGIVAEAFGRSTTSTAASPAELLMSGITDDAELTREEFATMIKTIDSGLRGLPATAQVARQQGEYLAKLFSENLLLEDVALPASYRDFDYSHKGALAYVGADRAVMDVPVVGSLYGLGAGVAWKGFETLSQFSWRNRALVSIDWVRTKVFGRDISRV